MMNKIVFITPKNPRGVLFDIDHAKSMLERIDRGEDVGGWKLKNEKDRDILGMPLPSVLIQTETEKTDADRPGDKGDSESTETKGAYSGGG